MNLTFAFALLALGDGADPSAVESRLRELAAQPGSAKVQSIGKSIGGKDLWCLTLSEGDDAGKPALLVVGGAHGAHALSTHLALESARELLGRAQNDGAAKDLLKARAIYIIPQLNPDGAAGLVGNPAREHAANARPVDEDRDRRIDEDAPDDVDGDGVITWMRIPDPKGEWLLDEKDPRILRKADRTKGERGTHRLVPEGLDDDGDGQWNEDAAGGIRIDRNFAHGWKEHDRATGTSAMSEPESRALADFLLSHPNIAACVVFGPHDNVRKAPRAGGEGGGDGEGGDGAAPGGGGRGGRGRGGAGGGGGGAGAPTAILRDDLAIHERAAKLYKEVTGLEGDVEDLGSDGALHAWAYFQRGLPTFAIRGWVPPSGDNKSKDDVKAKESESGDARPRGGRGGRRGGEERADSKPADGEGEGSKDEAASAPASKPAKAPAAKPEEDKSKAERTRLQWNDEKLSGAGFVAWKPSEHPALKAKGIEIGGWKPGVLWNPPAAEVPELARKHTDFLLALAPELFPKVVFASSELTSHGGGLATLKASIRNDGKAPVMTAMGRRAGSVRALRVKLTVDRGEITVGRPQFLVSDLGPEDAPAEWTWVLRGEPGAKVTLEVSGPFTAPLVFQGEIR